MANLKEELHTDSQELLGKTFEVLRLKMISNQEKYGWSNEWLTRDWENECREGMIKHIQKGDPRDVAIYALFMIYKGWSTKDEHQKDNIKQVDDKEWIAQLESMLKSRTQEVKELKAKIANLPKKQPK